ncbi:hypothetical protein B0H13DRAFT_1875981 [Mycena leptocephala]|nr:hypothetical protein B0H13DRAFT_1875981 [Mycena leptocephala]
MVYERLVLVQIQRRDDIFCTTPPLLNHIRLCKQGRCYEERHERQLDVEGRQAPLQAAGVDTLPVFFPEPGGVDPGPGKAFTTTHPDSPGSLAPSLIPTDLYDPDTAPVLREATTAAREGVWSNGHRVVVEEEREEEDADEAMYMDTDLESEDDFWDDEEQYDEYEWLYGLLAGDIVDEDMERELAEFGASPSLF